MSRQWERQKAEIDSYNTFLSAYHSRASYHGFSEEGYVVSNYFPKLSDPHTGTETEPDFILYNGGTVILVEIKQGNNISSRHIEQMEKNNDISIEYTEDFLKDSQVQRRFGLNGDVFSVETCIVYDDMDEEYVEKCREKWPDCQEKLKEMENKTAILGQESGSKLQILAGEFDSPDLQSWLEYGIDLPPTSRTTVSLTDGLEMESIAVSLCNIWGQRAVSDSVLVSVKEIRSHFDHRELKPGDVTDAFEYLSGIDACEAQGKRKYEFRQEHLDQILDIERIIANEDDTDVAQKGLDDFS